MLFVQDESESDFSDSGDVDNVDVDGEDSDSVDVDSEDSDNFDVASGVIGSVDVDNDDADNDDVDNDDIENDDSIEVALNKISEIQCALKEMLSFLLEFSENEIIFIQYLCANHDVLNSHLGRLFRRLFNYRHLLTSVNYLMFVIYLFRELLFEQMFYAF